MTLPVILLLQIVCAGFCAVMVSRLLRRRWSSLDGTECVVFLAAVTIAWLVLPAPMNITI